MATVEGMRPTISTRLRRIRVSDVTLLVAVIATTVHGVWAWRIGYSVTRDLFVTYALTGTALVVGYWRYLTPDRRISSTAFLAATWFGYLTWLPAVGSNVAGNIWREWLLAAAFLVFGAALGRSRWTSWQGLFIALAFGLAFYQVLALVFSRDNLLEALSGPGQFYASRPLSASLALLMLFGFVLVLARPIASSRPLLLGGGAFLGLSVVLSQHRSVWMAVFVAVPLLVLLQSQRGKVSSQWLICALSPLVYAGASLVLSATMRVSLLPGGSIESLGTVGVPEAAANTATFSWRLEMWQSRLTAPRSLWEWLFGGVFGVSPVKWPATNVMNNYISGHNAFVDLVTMYGLAGLALAAVLVWQSLRVRAVKRSALGVFIVAGLVYGVFYSLPSWSWVVIGIALALGSQRGPDPLIVKTQEVT